ncbi:polysaccharide deacetylase family protein [Sphingomonas sp. M1-B02]|uniref:polysaccharide deacetylase family protein n=1 Tax=Sphingomonas sp. M1-B02 TaxID=3114300 RepID=UPI00223F75A4|nr:polysaccharide deacetylase family protein [Sphingomonas sp. S6-11]UZK67550.1 polysaccharide deacetylase family protein [Sphingomonas sp. S6-11]
MRIAATRLFLFLAASMLLVRADAMAQSAGVPAKRIALTFDDAPRAPGAFLTPDERGKRLLAALRAAGVRQVAFFVNPGAVKGEADTARLSGYAAAGHVLANHSFTHPHLKSTDAAAYLADIDKAETWLKGRPGYRPWFRFPFLDEGGPDKAKRDAVRAGLKARGLQNGYVTVDGSDWNMEQLTIDAVKAGKTIDRAALRDLYVETHVESANFAHGLMQQAIGRAPAQVMLLHETDLAALYIGDLIAALRKDGWEIISPDRAYADPIHEAMPDTPWAAGTLTEALAWEKKLPAPRWYARNDTKIANALFAARVLHQEAQ